MREALAHFFEAEKFRIGLGESALYFLDLLRHRDISNQIVHDFQVHHESPQLLVIKDGECILDQSHGSISMEEALSVLS